MDELLPKKGEQTSSFKVVALAAATPIVLLVVILIGLIFVDEPRVREALVQALIYAVLPSIFGGAAVGYKYIGQREAVAVAKLDAYKAINAPAPDVKIEHAGKE